jgi:hypothetical protein
MTAAAPTRDPSAPRRRTGRRARREERAMFQLVGRPESACIVRSDHARDESLSCAGVV